MLQKSQMAICIEKLVKEDNFLKDKDRIKKRYKQC